MSICAVKADCLMLHPSCTYNYIYYKPIGRIFLVQTQKFIPNLYTCSLCTSLTVTSINFPQQKL